MGLERQNKLHILTFTYFIWLLAILDKKFQFFRKVPCKTRNM